MAATQMTIEIPSAAAETRIVNALCADAGWSADSGKTRKEFAKQVVADMVRDRVQAVETRLARAAAVASVTPAAPVDLT